MLIIKNVFRFRIRCHKDVSYWLKKELESKHIFIVNRENFIYKNIKDCPDIEDCYFECESTEEDLNALIDSLKEYHKGVISISIYTTKDWTER